MLEKILDIETNASNKELYRIVPKEDQGKRNYRIDQIKKDMQKRIQELGKYTGVQKFNINIENLRRLAFLKLMEKKGLAETNEYEDIYFLLVDEEIRNMEKNKDKIRKARIVQMTGSNTNKLIIPGQPKNADVIDIGDGIASRTRN